MELTFAGSEWELRAVGSGDKAAGLLAEYEPDIVLADAMMPGLTGYELCEAVKRLPYGAFIPVVMLTGHSSLSTARVPTASGRTRSSRSRSTPTPSSLSSATSS